MSYNSRTASAPPPSTGPSDPSPRPRAKPIQPHKFRDVREKLRAYRMAVILQDDPVPTSLESSSPFQAAHSSQGSSSASRTFPPALSEASYATSHTDFTVVFSQQDGNYLSEPPKKALCPVMRTQKALIRYLGSCLGDCRKRKVKCPLSHHSLEDILDGSHDEQSEADVEWALSYDPEAKGSDIISGVHRIEDSEIKEEHKSSILENIDNAANKLDIHTAPDHIYPSTINEVDFEDLLPEPEELAQCSHIQPSISFQSFDPPSVQRWQFSILETDRTCLLAIEIEGSDSNGLSRYYVCLFCDPKIREDRFRSVREVLDHTHRHHPGVVPMGVDPMRLVCPGCMTFCAERSNPGTCPNPMCSSQLEPVVSICGEKLPG